MADTERTVHGRLFDHPRPVVLRTEATYDLDIALCTHPGRKCGAPTQTKRHHEGTTQGCEYETGRRSKTRIANGYSRPGDTSKYAHGMNDHEASNQICAERHMLPGMHVYHAMPMDHRQQLPLGEWLPASAITYIQNALGEYNHEPMDFAKTHRIKKKLRIRWVSRTWVPSTASEPWAGLPGVGRHGPTDSVGRARCTDALHNAHWMTLRDQVADPCVRRTCYTRTLPGPKEEDTYISLTMFG